MLGGEEPYSYQWYADGEEIEDATDDELLVTSLMIGSKITVAVMDADGNSDLSDPTKPVSNVAAEITVIDASGLQEDGTGLVGDLLTLSYGSELGVPKTITWYYNEKVVKAWDSNGGRLDEALALQTGDGNGADYNGLLEDGEYYAVIINSAGGVFVSNTVELTYVVQAAVISDFDIADDLTKKEYVDVDDEDDNAVVSVTLNKAYSGTFYIYEEDIQNYNIKRASASWNNYDNTAADYAAATRVYVASEFTTAKVLKDGTPLVYINNATGETTFMFKVNKPLTRGSSYKLAFSQPAVESTVISENARKDIETTEAVLVDYLPAPASLKIATLANGAKASVKVLDAAGADMSWLGNGGDVTDEGFKSFKVYGNTSMAEKDAAELATTGTLKGGAFTSTAAVATGVKKFFYAAATTEAGIFGKDSVTIKSEFRTENTSIATKAAIAEDSTDPAKANVTLETVVGAATAYIYNTEETFDKDDKSTYLGKATLKAGDGSVSFENVFKRTNIGDKFAVAILPDDTNSFVAYTGDEWTLKNKATSIEVASTATGAVADHAGTTLTGFEINLAGWKVKNQFGDVVTDTSVDVANKTATVAVKNADNATTEACKAGYTITNGALDNIEVTVSEGFDIGDGFDITVLDKTFTLTSKAPQAWGGAALTDIHNTGTGNEEYMKLVSGGKTYQDGVPKAAVTVNSMAQLKNAINAGDNTHATAITIANGVTETDFADDITIPVATTINIGTGDLTFTGTVVNKGTIVATTTNQLKVAGSLTNEGTLTAPAGSLFVLSGGKLTLTGAAAASPAGVTLNDGATLYNQKTANIPTIAFAAGTVTVGYDAGHAVDVKFGEHYTAKTTTYTSDDATAFVVDEDAPYAATVNSLAITYNTGVWTITADNT